MRASISEERDTFVKSWITSQIIANSFKLEKAVRDEVDSASISIPFNWISPADLEILELKDGKFFYFDEPVAGYSLRRFYYSVNNFKQRLLINVELSADGIFPLDVS